MKKLFLWLSCFCLAFSLLLYGKSLVLFSPDDRPTKKLIDLIDGTKQKIHAAVYMITDKTIAEALVRAKNRGVDVQIITDKITMGGYGKGEILLGGGVPVYVFDTTQKKPKLTPNKPKPNYQTNKNNNKFFNNDPIMHNKFALFDCLIWTGSFNWTQSANRKNRENVLITDDREVYEKYQKEFNFLKEEYCNVNSKTCANTKKQLPKQEDEKILNMGAVKKMCIRFFDFVKETLTLA